MAYIITSDETKTNIFRIAENDSAKNNLYLPYQCVSNTISDSDFANLKNNTKIVIEHDGTNYIYNNSGAGFNEESTLTDYLNEITRVISNALERYPNHPDASIWTNYKNFVDNFDTSTLTFPLINSWEKYCEDNSITYINLLQLP